MKEMRIACWRKTIYSDDSNINEFLKGRDFSPGKHILRVNDEMHEIDVNAPNVDDSEFCKFNVCPVDTVGVEEACLENATTIDPIDKIKKITKVRRTDEMTTIKPLAEGLPLIPAYKYEEYTEEINVKGCPEGYVIGEKTDAIKWLGKKKPMSTAGIVADAMDENLEVMEPRVAAGMKMEIASSITCVKIQPMPMEKKWVEMITDSIIGWGGYAEFPFWDVPWGIMNAIAEKKGRWTGDYMAHDAKIEEGYRVCWNEYNYYPCACFKKKEDAKWFNESIKYYDGSKEFEKDTRDFLEEDFIDNKLRELYPKEQKKLDIDAQEDGNRLVKKIKEKYKEEMEAEITDEIVQEKMETEKQFFFEDLENQYESYLGYGEKSFREEEVQFVSKHEGKKTINYVVLVKEDL